MKKTNPPTKEKSVAEGADAKAVPAFPNFAAPEEEAADECEWEATFAASQSLLARLAEEAREERRQGKTVPLETILDDESR